MFDQRKFWLTISMFVLMIGAVIATAGAAFNALVGMPPPKDSQQVVTLMAPIQSAGGTAVPVEIERGVAAPAALPLSALVHHKPATIIAVTTPQIAVPAQLVVAERESTKRSESTKQRESTKRSGQQYKKTAALARKRQ